MNGFVTNTDDALWGKQEICCTLCHTLVTCLLLLAAVFLLLFSMIRNFPDMI